MAEGKRSGQEALFQALDDNEAGMTPSERAIAAWMRENIRAVPYNTGAQMAAAIGVSEPCAQVGQSGHPSPLPVSRTMPPVTMMRTSATTFATRMGRSQDG